MAAPLQLQQLSRAQSWQQWPTLHHHTRWQQRAVAAAAGGPVTLAEASSAHNPCIAVTQLPSSPGVPPMLRGRRILTLDASGNVHSVWPLEGLTSGAYWDALAVLPALVPQGQPISILGLAAGTVAWLLCDLYAEQQPGGRVLHGWELDGAVVDLARQHMGMQQLEDAGRLVVHVGDALAPDACLPGGSAGVVVDLFADGALIPQLTRVDSWRGIRQRLAPGGRAIANLGAAPVAGMPAAEAARTQAALDAMAEAFEGELVVSTCVINGTANLLALSGPPPTAEQWQAVPAPLQQFAKGSRFVGWQSHAEYSKSSSSGFFDW